MTIDNSENVKESGASQCQEMDSTNGLKIPFAYDDNGIIQFFEIGGKAPAHALISGMIGSGKASALHMLILQTVCNYQPGDVDIWAIDYKGIEFESYFNNRPPHFRVVTYETEEKFSLDMIGLLYSEYEKRKKQFNETGVNNISEFRAKHGEKSMSRIVVFIDEFQQMMRDIRTLDDLSVYITVLNDLLLFAGDVGISFILVSQSAASGLSGLSDSARINIGTRLLLKHVDDDEIRETLMLRGPDNDEIIEKAKRLKIGECIYMRTGSLHESDSGGDSNEFKFVQIIHPSKG